MPSTVSQVLGEAVTPNPTSTPYSFTINNTIDPSAPYTVYESGIPVLNNLVSIINGTTLQLLYPPDTTKQYTIDYNVLIQYVSAAITLPSNFQNYEWLADYVAFTSTNTVPYSVPITVGLTFDATGTATLSTRSDANAATSSLVADNGITTSIVPYSMWQYADAMTVTINSQIFDSNSIYTLTYNGRVLHPRANPTLKFEIFQYQSNVGGPPPAVWVPYNINQPVSNAQYVQFRMTFQNITNVNDAWLYSMSVKGLNQYGVGGTIPFLR